MAPLEAKASMSLRIICGISRVPMDPPASAIPDASERRLSKYRPTITSVGLNIKP